MYITSILTQCDQLDVIQMKHIFDFTAFKIYLMEEFFSFVG